METDTITITIPVYQRYDFFEEAIESAIDQTLRCRVLVVDNHSDHEKFRDYVKKLNNPRVRYFRNEKNLGMVNNWNRCIELADTPWVSILHDDDILHPSFIEILLNFITHYPDVGLVAGKVNVGRAVSDDLFSRPINITPNAKFIKNTYFLYRNLSPFPGVAFKKELVEKVGFFEPSLHPVADLYFWYRLACVTRTAILDEILAFYRISEQQESYSTVVQLIKANEAFKEMVIRENGITSLISRISILWARQQFIDYYNKTYPNSKVKNLKYERFLNNSGITRIMNRIRDAKSFI